MGNMWSGQGTASSLNFPAILLVEFWLIENESSVALPWGRGLVGGEPWHLPPASELVVVADPRELGAL